MASVDYVNNFKIAGVTTDALINTIVDSTGGTASTTYTLVDLASAGTWAAGVETKTEANFATLAVAVNAILVALRGAGVIRTF